MLKRNTESLAKGIIYIDRNLIIKLKAGDRKAYQVIFNVYSKSLFHFTFSYLKDSSDSEEIVQDVFMRLWEIRAEIDEDKSFKNFLYKITVNRVFNHLKHEVVRQKYANHLMKLDHSFSVSPEELVCRKELDGKVKELLSKLPVQKREIFEMSKLLGYSNTEISDKLGISIRTVENQVYRATKFFKEHLKDEYLFMVACGFLLFN